MFKINFAVLIALLFSGLCIHLGYMFSQINPDVQLYITLALIGVISGPFLLLFAAILLLVGLILSLFGQIQNFWNDLYPLNFGLALLGLSSFNYNPILHPILWLFLSFLFALLISFVIHKYNLIKYKILIFVLFGIIYIDGNWSLFMSSIIFVSLPVFSGVRKTIQEGLNGNKQTKISEV